MLRPLFAAALLLQCGGAYGFSLGASLPAMQRSSSLGAACRIRTSRAGATTVLAAASKEDAKAKGKWRGPGIPFKEKEYSAITASDGMPSLPRVDHVHIDASFFLPITFPPPSSLSYHL